MTATRRQFLGGAVAAASAVALAEESTTKRLRWQCGLGLNGFMSSESEFKKQYPLWEVLDFAANTGFDGIELVDGWPQGPYPKPGETARMAALKRLYDQYGLQIYTIQTAGAGVYSPDASRRKKWLEGFRGQVQLGRAFGCDFIGNWPGGGLAGNANVDEAIGNLAKGYRDAAKVCADAGMHLSFEIEPPFLFNTPEHLERILAEVDDPACKTNYDPSHFDLMWGSRGKPEEMLARIGVGHIGHVHLTDTDGTLFGGTSKHLACGEGHCDIPASLRCLCDGGYEGWIMIDGWKIEDVYNAARKGIHAIDAARERC